MALPTKGTMAYVTVKGPLTEREHESPPSKRVTDLIEASAKTERLGVSR